ncbi:hypothetical protein VNO80_03426 [Phaseolus coccineus]|uniref:VQ domain-containing protein n=1 Tax=Phaseolus coccineus TaxID=3886 RepID=A0AAN9RIU5_PHACN
MTRLDCQPFRFNTHLSSHYIEHKLSSEWRTEKVTRVISSPEQRAFPLSISPKYPPPPYLSFPFPSFISLPPSLHSLLHPLPLPLQTKPNKTTLHSHSSLFTLSTLFMASSQNVASIEPWTMLRPPVSDSWLAEFLTRDTDSITRALQKSLSAAAVFPEDNDFTPFISTPDSATAAATPTVSSLSGSDHDSAPRRRGPQTTGKISKRKSRASKRSQTTFITADPANFRQMVQQVTGVRFGAAAPIAPAVLKPEPQRPAGNIARFSGGAGCLPTLDTSAFLLDHNQQVVGHTSAGSGSATGLSMPGTLPFAPALAALDSHAASFASAGLDFDTLSSFPTLESWKVM